MLIYFSNIIIFYLILLNCYFIGIEFKLGQDYKNKISLKLEEILKVVEDLNCQLQSQLSQIKDANITVLNQENTKSLLLSRVSQYKIKLEESSSSIKSVYNDVKNYELKIDDVNQQISQTNKTINELKDEAAEKQNKLQELMNKIAQSNLKVKTPFKKSKSKSALKGGRSINHASISAKTPSTAESTNGKKMLIKRLAIEKVRNL